MSDLKIIDNIKGENILAFSENVNEILYKKAAEGLSNVSPEIGKQIAEGNDLQEGLIDWIKKTVDKISRSMKSRGFNKKLRAVIQDTIGELMRLERAVKSKDIKNVISIVQTLGRDHLAQIIAHVEILDKLSRGEENPLEVPEPEVDYDDDDDDGEESEPNVPTAIAKIGPGGIEVYQALSASYNIMAKSWDLISLHEAELSPEQKAYKALFDKIIAKYDVNSPNDMSDEEKKKFFNELEKEWAKHPDNEPEANEDEEE